MKSFKNNKTNRRVSKKQKHTRKYKGGTKDAAENIIAEFVKGERKANLTIIREQIKLLTKKTVNSKDKTGSSLLHQALSFGNEEIVRLLLGKGADINIISSRFGWTPLHTAVEFENESLLKLLLEKGAKTDIKDNSGETPLEKAEAMLDNGRPVKGIVDLLNNKNI